MTGAFPLKGLPDANPFIPCTPLLPPLRHRLREALLTLSSSRGLARPQTKFASLAPPRQPCVPGGLELLYRLFEADAVAVGFDLVRGACLRRTPSGHSS